jgi:hypothetical protein
MATSAPDARAKQRNAEADRPAPTTSTAITAGHRRRVHRVGANRQELDDRALIDARPLRANEIAVRHRTATRSRPAIPMNTKTEISTQQFGLPARQAMQLPQEM